MNAEYEDLPRSGFSGYFSARGLASRKQFWTVMLLVFIANIFLHPLFDAMLYQGGNADGIIEIATFGTVVVTIWIALATSVRRAKDAGVSPWLAILMLIPGVSLVMLLVLGSMSSKSR